MVENIKSGFKIFKFNSHLSGPINKLINITTMKMVVYCRYSSYRTFNWTIHYQYKCDQINGLIEFIKIINKI